MKKKLFLVFIIMLALCTGCHKRETNLYDNQTEPGMWEEQPTERIETIDAGEQPTERIETIDVEEQPTETVETEDEKEQTTETLETTEEVILPSYYVPDDYIDKIELGNSSSYDLIYGYFKEYIIGYVHDEYGIVLSDAEVYVCAGSQSPLFWDEPVTDITYTAYAYYLDVNLLPKTFFLYASGEQNDQNTFYIKDIGINTYAESRGYLANMGYHEGYHSQSYYSIIRDMMNEYYSTNEPGCSSSYIYRIAKYNFFNNIELYNKLASPVSAFEIWLGIEPGTGTSEELIMPYGKYVYYVADDGKSYFADMRAECGIFYPEIVLIDSDKDYNIYRNYQNVNFDDYRNDSEITYVGSLNGVEVYYNPTKLYLVLKYQDKVCVGSCVDFGVYTPNCPYADLRDDLSINIEIGDFDHDGSDEMIFQQYLDFYDDILADMPIYENERPIFMYCDLNRPNKYGTYDLLKAYSSWKYSNWALGVTITNVDNQASLTIDNETIMSIDCDYSPHRSDRVAYWPFATIKHEGDELAFVYELYKYILKDNGNIVIKATISNPINITENGIIYLFSNDESYTLELCDENNLK